MFFTCALVSYVTVSAPHLRTAGPLSQAKRCFHIGHRVVLHRSAHCAPNPYWLRHRLLHISVGPHVTACTCRSTGEASFSDSGSTRKRRDDAYWSISKTKTQQVSSSGNTAPDDALLVKLAIKKTLHQCRKFAMGDALVAAISWLR